MNQEVQDVVSKQRTQFESHRDEYLIEMRTVLQELYLLLEDYAPVWYTREHHDRALRAMLQRDL